MHGEGDIHSFLPPHAHPATHAPVLKWPETRRAEISIDRPCIEDRHARARVPERASCSTTITRAFSPFSAHNLRLHVVEVGGECHRNVCVRKKAGEERGVAILGKRLVSVGEITVVEVGAHRDASSDLGRQFTRVPARV